MSAVLEILEKKGYSLMESETTGLQSQPEVDATFHPLSSTTFEKQECYDQLDLKHLTTSVRSVQSVQLDDAIYIHGDTSPGSMKQKYVLYKYSITKASWYKLRTEAADYALATYQSKVVMIGGVLPTQSQDKYSEAVIVLDDDCGLGEKLNSSLKQDPNIHDRFKFKNACAVSTGQFLIVVGAEKQFCNTRFLSSLVYDGHVWKSGKVVLETDVELNSSTRWTLHILSGEVYMTCYGSSNKITLFHTSIDLLVRTTNGSESHWNVIENAPGNHCPQVMILGSHLVKMDILGGSLKVYAYLPSSSKWVEVEDVPIALRCMTCVVGLQSPSPADQVESIIVGRCDDYSPTSVSG